MGFKHFRFGVLWRALVLTGLLLVCVLLAQWSQYVAMGIMAFFAVLQLMSLIRYVEQTNYKIQYFLESIRYSDFTLSFNTNSRLGASFRELHTAFDEVMAAFKQTRTLSEENLRYLNTVVQHVDTGLMVWDETGHLELYNNAAKRMLGLMAVRQLSDIREKAPKLHGLLVSLRPGQSRMLHTTQPIEQQLVVRSTSFKMRGKTFQLVSLQNIKPELEAKELEAWRNLSKVLRHEIMNSITPIASLSGTAKSLIGEIRPYAHVMEEQEGLNDLELCIDTIERRSKSLLNFVEAYRNFTSLPTPQLQNTQSEQLLSHVVRLMQDDLHEKGIEIKLEQADPNLQIPLDPELIEMVLINLVKNAGEALEGQAGARIRIAAGIGSNQRAFIKVEDNGPGIMQEALERIFVPFYTTKKGGSGIGLAWSRQIMHLHGGSLNVHSREGQGASFVLSF